MVEKADDLVNKQGNINKISTVPIPELEESFPPQVFTEPPRNLNPWHVVFEVVHTGSANNRASIVVNTGYIILGRRVPGAPVPTVNFDRFDGHELGVSRQHAVVRRMNRRVYTIEDMGSANGTWLNGRRLVSLSPTRLRSGDRIRLGQLLVDVFFKEAAGGQVPSL